MLFELCGGTREDVEVWIVGQVGEPLGTGLKFRVSMTHMGRGLISQKASIKSWQL